MKEPSESDFILKIDITAVAAEVFPLPWATQAKVVVLFKAKDGNIIEALRTLNKINPQWIKTKQAKEKLPEFILALIDKDEDVREAATKALNEINPQWMETKEAIEKVPEFILALKDEERH